MKNLLFCLTLCLSLSAIAQSKITYLYDKDLLSPEAETLLAGNLKAYNLEYTSQIDLNNKCDYLFANIQIKDNQIYLTIKDCYDISRGSALVGKLNQRDIPQAYAGALSFLTNDILQNPDKYKEPASKSNSNSIDKDNEHASRYFFAPSGYNLKKGELYGSTNYFLLYDFQYGITENFSLGMGSTIAALPFYITPKISFKLGDNGRLAVGDMLVVGTWGLNFTANLPYIVYTYGNSNTNVTAGLAYLSAGGSSLDTKIKRPVFNLSGMAKLSEYMYLVSENYFSMGTSSNITSEYLGFDPVTFQSIYKTYEYERSSNIAMGALGFRFISKRKDVQSIQFGLAYFINSYNDTYKDGKKPSYVVNTSYVDQFFIPTLTLFYKFGRKV
ncbi:MAG: hypothetical protein ACKVQB_07545 [Bacteroidia bacterium]